MDTRMRWVCRDRIFSPGEKPLIMGILNVTPDSFSDGGKYAGKDAAVERGIRMVEEGADILDVGGESTRPGAPDVPEDEELKRVLPVIEALAERAKTAISIDTSKAKVARRALECGACIINDVSAFSRDPEMADVAAESGAGAVLMHMRGTPRTMQENPSYKNVVEEVAAYLQDRVHALKSAGLKEETIALDPGIGFGKTVEHNLELLAHLETLAGCGRPVVVGLSRKSFLGKLTDREVGDRLAGSLAALTFCVLHGAHVMRVHDVKETYDAIRVASALRVTLEKKGGKSL